MLRLAVLVAAALASGPAWPQAAEVGHAVTGATDSLLDKGVLGTVSVIGLLATAVLAWRYSALWDARLADAKAAAADLRAANREMADALNASAKASAALSVAMESQGRETERRYDDIKGDLGAVQEVKAIVLGNAETMRRIETDVRPPPVRGAR